MDSTRSYDLYESELEADILGQIVDAMLASESQLKHASVREWRDILVESCRRQKRSQPAELLALC